jgi:hypothetical protein
MVRTRVSSEPRPALIKAWVFFVPESRDPVVSGPNPTQRGPGPVLGVRFAPVEVLDLTRRSGPYIQGSGATRLEIAASSHCSKGYPCFRVPTVAPRTTSGEDTSLQVGPNLVWRLARRFRVLADVIIADPPSVMPSATSVPAAD